MISKCEGCPSRVLKGRSRASLFLLILEIIMKKLFLLTLCFSPELLYSMQTPPQQPTLQLRLKKRDVSTNEILKEDWLEFCGDCCCPRSHPAGPLGCCICAACTTGCNLILNRTTQNYFACHGLSDSAFQTCMDNSDACFCSTLCCLAGITIFAAIAENYSIQRKEKREKLKYE